MSTLSQAARKERLKSVEQLIEAGADMNASDYKDFTTIMCAACDRGDQWEMAELLIKMGAYVNQTGKDDNSSMLWLCKNHRGFLRAGACVNLAEQALPLSWLRLTLGMNRV